MLIAFTAMAIAAIIIMRPKQKTVEEKAVNSGGAFEKKVTDDKATQNYIMRRFVSYADVIKCETDV